MLYLNEILLFSVFLAVLLAVWLYYRHQFIEVLTDLEDKKAIIAALANHSTEIERGTVRKISTDRSKKNKQTAVEKKPRIVTKTKK